jgi:membrane protein
MKRTLSIINRFFAERFHDQSAQMAYFLMLSVFPFLIFVISMLSFLPVDAADILRAIQQYAPRGSYYLIESNISDIVSRHRTKLASISLLAAFWISFMAVQALVRAMNDAYGINRKERFLLAFGKDLFLTAIIMMTLTISLLVPIGEEIGRTFLSARLEFSPISYPGWMIVKWGIGTLYLFFFFLLFYKLVPSGNIPFASVIPGALFATVSWQAVSIGFSYYVSYVNYSLLYGQLSGMVVLMIWFYLTAAVLLTGGLINAELTR